MRYCDNCNVLINNDKDDCLLCMSKTKDVDSKKNVETYPLYTKVNKGNLYSVICAIISSALGVLAIILNLLFYDRFSVAWSLAVCFSSFLIWVALRLIIFSRKNVTLKLTFAHTTIFWLLLFIDVTFTSDADKYWSLIYASPIMSLLFLSITLVMIFYRKNSYPDYFGNLLLNVLFLITPIVLCFSLYKVDNLLLPLISSVIGLITLFCMFVLPSSKTRNEIKKRLHI